MSDLSNGVYLNAGDKGLQLQAEKQSYKGAAEATEVVRTNRNPRGVAEKDRPRIGPVTGSGREFRFRHALQGDERSAALDAQHDAARSQARRQWHSDRIHDIYSFLLHEVKAPVNQHRRLVAHTQSHSPHFPFPPGLGSKESGPGEGRRVGGVTLPPQVGRSDSGPRDTGADLPSLLFFSGAFVVVPLSLLLWLLLALAIRGLM
jgi:hypothetical protein